MKTRNSVRAIVYDTIDGEKSYLLLKARKKYWQNPQGGIENNESDLEALVREVKEETGLEVEEILTDTKNYIEYDAKRKGKKKHVKLVTYAVKADSSGRVKLSEKEGHTAYAWVDYNTALDMLSRYPEQRKVFVEVVNKLLNGYNSRIL